jgi:HSP20 family protein
MTVARVNGQLLDRLPETYGSLLDKFFTEGVTAKRNLTKFHPQVDAIETQQAFKFEVALPGFRKEDVQLELHEGKLTISGERKFDTENKENKYHFIETNYGRFTRSFFLPDNINEGAIEAQFQNGLLTVVVPKDEQKVLKRQIEIK